MSVGVKRTSGASTTPRLMRFAVLPVTLGAEGECPCALIPEFVQGGRLGADGRQRGYAGVLLIHQRVHQLTRKSEVLHRSPARVAADLRDVEVRVAGRAGVRKAATAGRYNPLPWRCS